MSVAARNYNIPIFNTVNVQYSSLSGQSVIANSSITVSSINTSTLTTSTLSYSTITGSTINASILIVSTLNCRELFGPPILNVTTSSIITSTLGGGTTFITPNGANTGTTSSLPQYLLDVSGTSRVAALQYQDNSIAISEQPVLDYTTFGQNWVQSNTPTASWYSIVMSVTGQYQIACVSGGALWYSSTYGQTWTQSITVGTTTLGWRAVASSASGQYMTAVSINGGPIWYSFTYGQTWTQSTTQGTSGLTWSSISQSATGQYVSACINGGFIWYSTNYGQTWTQTATSQTWSSISLSASGQNQSACINGGYIYISVNYGQTWVQTASSQAWTSIAQSASGQYQSACINGGFIYLSTNYGQTWTQTASNLPWINIKMALSGQYQIASISMSYSYSTIPTYLYPFNSFTFTPNGATGAAGPTAFTYNTSIYPWVGTYLTLNAGIQVWTVPATGTYRITAAGAGGNQYNNDGSGGGRGVIVSTSVTLTKGNIIYILVGQTGVIGSAYYYASGGGGTFVCQYNGGPTTSASSYTILLIAGGGGGRIFNTPNADAVITTSGGVDTAFANYPSAATNGAGGNVSLSPTSNDPVGESGAGFIGNGNGTNKSRYGITAIPSNSFINGGSGGIYISYSSANGGFGGGGCGGTAGRPELANASPEFGGGGGYSGGSGPSITQTGTYTYSAYGAGGGGSYDINGINNNATLFGYNPAGSDGYATISLTSPLYYSSDYGQSWNSVFSPMNPNALSLSSTGQYMSATVNSGQIYTSVTNNPSIASGNATITGNTTISTLMYNDNTSSITSNTTLDYSTFAQNWSTVPGISGTSIGIATSATGQYQTATNNQASNGWIYYSSNYGQTWTQASISSSQGYVGIAMSASGQYQVCGVNTNGPGSIYLSSNYGQTWSAISGQSGTWNGFCCSASGQYMTGIVFSGYIYYSSNYGQTWTQAAASYLWTGICCSASGQYQYACYNGGSIYQSTNYGQTWTLIPNTTFGTLVPLCCSASGKYVTTAAYSNGIYYSSNYGQTWTQSISTTGITWNSIRCTASGQYQVAVNSAAGGSIYYSINYGRTWTIVANTGYRCYVTAINQNGQYVLVSSSSALYSSITSYSYVNINNIVTANSIGNPSYTTLLGGIILQTGSVSITTVINNPVTSVITFPKVFPTNVFSVVASLSDTGPGYSNTNIGIAVSTINTSTFTALLKYVSGTTQSVSTIKASWQAIGN